MPTSNRLSLLFTLLLLILIPFLLGQAMLASLAKLHLTPEQAVQLMIAIVAGSLVNIPIKRMVTDQPVWSHPLSIYGLDHTIPRWRTVRHETIIAVNVGGCLVPLGIAFFQLAALYRMGPDALWATGMASLLTTFVCFVAARPIPGRGIMMPGFLSPVMAAIAAVYFAPDYAPPVAFVAGVVGPLVGADFLHIHELVRRPGTIGMASIGGAGTFDGIVLSAILATLLA